MISENKDQRKKIEDDAWHEIDDIKDENKAALVTIIDQGMHSKTLLTEIQAKFKQQKNTKEQLASDIKDKQNKLNELLATQKDLKD